jgi:hypothetical protein
MHTEWKNKQNNPQRKVYSQNVKSDQPTGLINGLLVKRISVPNALCQVGSTKIPLFFFACRSGGEEMRNNAENPESDLIICVPHSQDTFT